MNLINITNYTTLKAKITYFTENGVVIIMQGKMLEFEKTFLSNNFKVNLNY